MFLLVHVKGCRTENLSPVVKLMNWWPSIMWSLQVAHFFSAEDTTLGARHDLSWRQGGMHQENSKDLHFLSPTTGGSGAALTVRAL